MKPDSYIESIKALPAAEAAVVLTRLARDLDEEGGIWYVKVGFVCVQVEDRWEELKMCDETGKRFQFFTDWLLKTMPKSESTAREAKTKVRVCSPEIPEAVMRKIAPCKIRQLANCPTAAVRKDREVIELALNTGVTEDQFVKRVNEKHNQHLTPRNANYFRPNAEQLVVWEVAIAQARTEDKRHGEGAEPTREEAITTICEDYIAQHTLVEETSSVGVGERVM